MIVQPSTNFEIDMEQVERIAHDLKSAIIVPATHVMLRAKDGSAVNDATLAAAECQAYLQMLGMIIVGIADQQDLHRHLLKVAGNHVSRLAFIGRNGG